ncbi:MAG: hypothetical protein ACRYFS_13410 [Janthinobacterium lividum]
MIENSDDTAAFGVTYQQLVEGKRPDVVLIRREVLAGLYSKRYRAFTNIWYYHDLKRRYPRVAALYPAYGIDASQVLMEDPLRRIIRDAVVRRVPVCVLAPDSTPVLFNIAPFTDDDGSHLRFDTYLLRHYQLATVGLVTQVYANGQMPSSSTLHAETERLWQSYSLRGVFSGDLQHDHYLALLALNYGNGSLARANLAYSQGDYAAAQTSYADVLSLFTCDAATQGLQRCAQAQHSVLSADNSP